MADNKDNIKEKDAIKDVENSDDAEKKDDDIDLAKVAECKKFLTNCAVKGTDEKYAEFRESAVSLMFLIGKFIHILCGYYLF